MDVSPKGTSRTPSGLAAGTKRMVGRMSATENTAMTTYPMRQPKSSMRSENTSEKTEPASPEVPMAMLVNRPMLEWNQLLRMVVANTMPSMPEASPRTTQSA